MNKKRKNFEIKWQNLLCIPRTAASFFLHLNQFKRPTICGYLLSFFSLPGLSFCHPWIKSLNETAFLASTSWFCQKRISVRSMSTCTKEKRFVSLLNNCLLGAPLLTLPNFAESFALPATYAGFEWGEPVLMSSQGDLTRFLNVWLLSSLHPF